MLNQTLQASALLQAPQGIQSLEECGRACISDRNCLSFSFGTMDTDTMVTCELYLAVQAEGIIVETLGLSYYEKIQDRVSISPWVVELAMSSCHELSTSIIGAAILPSCGI